MTPLIDIVFLLLLFFMLASTFARFASVELTLASEGAGATAAAAPVHNVLLTVREGAAFAVDGYPASRQEIAARLQARRGEGEWRVIVRPSSEAIAQDVLAAVEAAREAAIGPVLLVH